MNGSTKASLKTAVYVRVSTDEQVQEGYSIRAQIDKLKSYALLKDWDIIDIYNDEGISGKNIVDRPAINRLIDDINDGKVNNVLVFKVDRLTRSTRNLLELVELFEANDCAFNSLTESLDTQTPSGRMFLKIIGIFAEFERENLVSRLKMGFERKAKEGYTLANASISYGYSKEKGQKVQTILPDEAKIVREIFEMYVDENMSMSGIAKVLNQRKIPTKKKAPSWDATTIKAMLTNPTYIGKVRYSIADEKRYFEVEGQHERILPDQIFNLAQEKISRIPKILRTKRPREVNYFCGVLTCACCGSKFSTQNYTNKAGENKCSYKCIRNTSYKSADIECKMPRINHEKMEAAFIEYIKNIDDFNTVNDVNIDNDNAKKERELQVFIADCERKLESLHARKKRIAEQYFNEEISFEEYKEISGVFNGKLETLEGELVRAKAESPTAGETSDIAREDIIANLQENWDGLNNSERMAFLQRFIKRITIRVEKEHAKSNKVKIERLEFNPVNMALIEGKAETATRQKLQERQR